MFANLFSLSLLSLVLPITALASSHGNSLLNRHHEIAKRAEGNVQLWKRVTNSRWSYYDVETGNAGSCGRFHVNSDFTVALNDEQMNKGLCFRSVRLTYNGKTTTATISDTCPGCPWGGMDLTAGLFEFFAPHSAGIIYGEWEFSDGSGGGGAPAPAPAPTTTRWTPPPPPPTPTTTWTPPPPPPPTTTRTSTRTSTTSSTTSSPPPAQLIPSSSSSSSSSTFTSSSTTISSTTSVDYSSGVASGLAVPTGSINRTPGQASNLADLNQVFIQMGGIVAAGPNV